MIPQHALQTADWVAGALGLLDRDLDGAGLLDFAERRCRLHGFGAAAAAAPLRVLLPAYSREASLSLVGRAAARWDVQRFLSNLARMAEEEKARPGIRDEPVAAPVFVTGLPRSGTTFLFRLLAEDGGHRVPRMWETIHPYPDPGPPPSRAPRSPPLSCRPWTKRATPASSAGATCSRPSILTASFRAGPRRRSAT